MWQSYWQPSVTGSLLLTTVPAHVLSTAYQRSGYFVLVKYTGSGFCKAKGFLASIQLYQYTGSRPQ